MYDQKTKHPDMQMTLSMRQMPPVIFFEYPVAGVVDEEIHEQVAAGAASREALFSACWMDYGRSLLASVEPCMEANEGVADVVRALAGRSDLVGLSVAWLTNRQCVLSLEGRRLYLSESFDGEVSLFFACPGTQLPGLSSSRLDLTDYGTETVASFIAAVFRAAPAVAGFCGVGA